MSCGCCWLLLCTQITLQIPTTFIINPKIKYAYFVLFYFESTELPASSSFCRLDAAPSSGPGPPRDLSFVLPPSKMEALGGYPTKSSSPKAKKLTVLLSMTVGVGCLFLLQTQLVKPRKPKDFYAFEVKDAKGRTVTLEKYRGKVCPHHHISVQSENGKICANSI